MTLVYKIVNGLVAVPVDTSLTPADSRTRAAHSKKFKLIATKTHVAIQTLVLPEIYPGVEQFTSYGCQCYTHGCSKDYTGWLAQLLSDPRMLTARSHLL